MSIIFTVMCDNFSYDFNVSTFRPRYLQFLAPSLRSGHARHNEMRGEEERVRRVSGSDAQPSPM
jgi:hypothetical protein